MASPTLTWRRVAEQRVPPSKVAFVGDPGTQAEGCRVAFPQVPGLALSETEAGVPGQLLRRPRTLCR